MNIVMFDKDNKRIGTPVIEKSLIGAIRLAINDWNEKLNGLSSKYLDSPAVGTVVVIGIFMVSEIVIAELNKK